MPTRPRTVPNGARTIDGITLQITHQICGAEHRFLVHRADSGAALTTADTGFEYPPTVAQLADLLDEQRGQWRFHCGHHAPSNPADLIGDHLRDCTTPPH
jgi:hypothetical protein